jgi:hypothetical protein
MSWSEHRRHWKPGCSDDRDPVQFLTIDESTASPIWSDEPRYQSR